MLCVLCDHVTIVGSAVGHWALGHQAVEKDKAFRKRHHRIVSAVDDAVSALVHAVQGHLDKVSGSFAGLKELITLYTSQ